MSCLCQKSLHRHSLCYSRNVQLQGECHLVIECAPTVLGNSTGAILASWVSRWSISWLSHWGWQSKGLCFSVGLFFDSKGQLRVDVTASVQ
eukprot:1032589-Ditylum_brightwellii.AAC.1